MLLIIPLFEFVDRKLILNNDVNTNSFKFTFSLIRIDKNLFGKDIAVLRLLGFICSIPLFIILLVLDFIAKLWNLFFGYNANQ